MIENPSDDLRRIVQRLQQTQPCRALAAEVVETIIGPVTIYACENGVISVDFGDQPGEDSVREDALFRNLILSDLPQGKRLAADDLTKLNHAKIYAAQGADELKAYFAGKRTDFTVALVYHGTEFQKAVWRALLAIPYGETRSYGDIAVAIGRPKAVRAVGQANRANPIAIIVPCHRVIGSGGSLVGYAGSQIGLKSALLELEQRTLTGCA